MKKRWILGIFISIGLLLDGCAKGDEDVGTSREELFLEAASESVLEIVEGGKDVEQTKGDSGSGLEKEPAMNDEEKEGSKDPSLFQKGSPQLVERVEAQSEALEGYRVFLTEYESKKAEEDRGDPVPGFALLYLDDDEIPELLVLEGTSHACGALLYSFQDEVIPIGVYGQYGVFTYYEKEGIVFDDYDTDSYAEFNVYRIEGNQEILLQSYSEQYVFLREGEELQCTYQVDGKEVSGEQYREVSDKWNEAGYRVIDYNMCRALAGEGVQDALREEFETLILTQEDVLKQNILIEADAKESDILLWDYDDYDRDGRCEAFMICGSCYDNYGTVGYKGMLYFAGADGCTLLRDDQIYRMIDGKMKLGPNRKYLFFYTDVNATANISELWTVEDGKPVESGFSQIGQVIYRGGKDFEIWMDAYDHWYEPANDLWLGHTYKPYFYHYNWGTDQIERYGGAMISAEAFEERSGTRLIEEIEEEGYTVETIIWWDNDVVTINYVIPENEYGCIYYENIIWDNTVKDFWEKEKQRVTSWKNAGVGGSFQL